VTGARWRSWSSNFFHASAQVLKFNSLGFFMRLASRSLTPFETTEELFQKAEESRRAPGIEAEQAAQARADAETAGATPIRVNYSGWKR